MIKYYFIHFFCLFLKSLKAFIVSLNICCLSKNFDDFQYLKSTNNDFNVIAISESRVIKITH